MEIIALLLGIFGLGTGAGLFVIRNFYLMWGRGGAIRPPHSHLRAVIWRFSVGIHRLPYRRPTRASVLFYGVHTPKINKCNPIISC